MCAERFATGLGVTVPFRVVELLRVDVPLVVGWLRPIIILPIAVCAEVPPAQIEAVLAHEIAHVYRRDYLVNLVQMVAEAVLFYHPGVWWISARIRVERELCCDDLAIQMCGDRMAYARALVTVEQLRVSRPQFGVAATDGPLVKRMRRILGSAETRECRRHEVSVVAATVLAIGLIAGIQAVATGSRLASSTQTRQVASVPSRAAFEVASVKANRSGLIEAGLRPAPDGSLVAHNTPLWSLLEFAYDVPAYRIQGLPDWAFKERFDITAKSGAAGRTSVDRIALMLRSLLADRFKLHTHTEVRQLPVFELQLDRADRRLGPDLMESTRGDCQALARGAFARQPAVGERPCGVAQGAGSLRATGVPLSRLAAALGRLVDRPVIDRTGLDGLFDADVSFRQDRSPLPVAVTPFDVPVNTSAPYIFTAVREQLGLRLVPGRDDVEVLVVTSIARPAPE
jgi:uncharacterized protein (TIGR03435 family)